MPGFPGIEVEAPPAEVAPPRTSFDWIMADGTQLSFSNWAIMRDLGGHTGRFMVPVEVDFEPAVGGSGDRVRQVRHLSRPYSAEFAIRADGEIELYDRIRTIARALDPKRGVGTLRINRIDGTSRDLTCHYVGGLEGDSAEMGRWWLRAVVGFRGADPYWYDTVGVGYSWKAEDPPMFFNPGFPPMVLGESSINDPQTVINDGDVDTWPIWTVRGPFTQVLIVNQTTGKSMTINATIDASGWIQIDTRPGFKSVKDHTGENRYAAVASTQGSTLFPMGAGENVILTTITGATGGVTQLELLLFRRYLTP